jgi:hypothetical protein
LLGLHVSAADFYSGGTSQGAGAKLKSSRLGR